MSEAILVTAMHRSGSTNIAKVICQSRPGLYYPGFVPLGTLGDDPHMFGLEDATRFAERFSNLPFVLHGHVLGTDGTLNAIMKAKIEKVIVCVRKVKDSLLSVCVAHRTGAQMPNVHLPHSWRDWGSDHQMMWLIRNFSPWLFSFYATWKRPTGTLLVSYDKHYANEAAGNVRIFDYLGFEFEEERVAIPANETRRINAEKPRWTEEMDIELNRIAYSWGPMYELMKEDGVI